MYIEANHCPVCAAPCPDGGSQCNVCGSTVEIFFEHPLPTRDSIDEPKVQEAIDHARADLIEHENDGVAHYKLALAYLNFGLIDEGSAELQRSVQLLPEKAPVAYEAAVISVKRKDYSDDVVRLLDRAIDRQPNFQEAIYLKGFVLEKQGGTEQAVRLWQEAHQLDPDYLPPELSLEKYIRATQPLLENPQIVHSLRSSSLTKKERNYLDLINWTGVEKPRELGETSMSLLSSLSPAKAQKMRRIHAARVSAFKEAQAQHERLSNVMHSDLVSLSNLCLRAGRAQSSISVPNQAGSRQAIARQNDTMRRLSVKERTAILDQQIQQYQKQGYRLVSRTSTTAQLAKEHEFSCCLALILVLLVIGIILYLLYYLTAKKEHYVFLEVDEYGKVHTSYT